MTDAPVQAICYVLPQYVTGQLRAMCRNMAAPDGYLTAPDDDICRPIQ